MQYTLKEIRKDFQLDYVDDDYDLQIDGRKTNEQKKNGSNVSDEQKYWTKVPDMDFSESFAVTFDILIAQKIWYEFLNLSFCAFYPLLFPFFFKLFQNFFLCCTTAMVVTMLTLNLLVGFILSPTLPVIHQKLHLHLMSYALLC